MNFKKIKVEMSAIKDGVGRYPRLHVITFSLLSLYLFAITQTVFIHKVLALVICIGVLLIIRDFKFDFGKWYKTILFFAVSAYLTMAVFGYDSIIYLPEFPERARNLVNFGFGFVWTCYVLQSVLNLVKTLEQVKDRKCTATDGGYWKKWFMLLAIMFAMFLTWQIAFNPIVLTPDSWGYLSGWLSGWYSTFRSPVYAFLINIICTVAPTEPEVLWIAVAQNLAFSSLLATILMYLHSRWIRLRYIIAAAIVLPLIPSFGLHTIVVWVDLASGIAMLWFTYALVRITDEMILHNKATRGQQISFCIQLCISMVLVYFIRSNSFPVYLVMVPVLGILFLLRKEWKLLITIVASVTIVVLIQFPGYRVLGVNRSDFSYQHRYFAGMHDIQATYYADGDLPESTLAALRKYITKLDDPGALDMFEQGYARHYENFFAYNMNELTLREFIPMYIDSFVRNPYQMTRSILYRTHIYWVIDSKGIIYDINETHIYNVFAGTNGMEVPEIGVYRQPNFLTDIMTKYMEVMTYQIPATFVWRFGIYTAIMMISAMTLILQKRFIYLLAYLPVIIYLGTLFIAGHAPAYRYGLPVFFIGLFLPLTLLLLKPPENMGENVQESPV